MANRVDMSQHDPKLIQALERRAILTPDYRDLRALEDIPVFVYGTLKRGKSNNGILKGAKYLGEAQTATSGYTMYDTGGFPVVMKENQTAKYTGIINGEVFAVDVDIMCRLDGLEHNGTMYQRHQNFVYLRDQELRDSTSKPGIKVRPSVRAWIYLGCDDYWGDGRLEQVLPSYDQSRRPTLTWRP